MQGTHIHIKSDAYRHLKILVILANILVADEQNMRLQGNEWGKAQEADPDQFVKVSESVYLRRLGPQESNIHASHPMEQHPARAYSIELESPEACSALL